MNARNTNTHSTIIRPEKLIGIYRRMKCSPQRVWISRDFGFGRIRESHRYMRTLERLGLIERVTAVYQTGKGYSSRSNTKAWKVLI